MNIETTTITKGKDEFSVENVEDMIIRVEVQQVDRILAAVNDVEEDEVVILLATIKKSRIAVTLKGEKAYEKADDELATRAIIELLGCYTISNLISIFEEIKYYQIKEVLESDSPIRALDEYI